MCVSFVQSYNLGSPPFAVVPSQIQLHRMLFLQFLL